MAKSRALTIGESVRWLPCVLRANGGVDRATALPSSLAGARLMRNSLPVAPVQRFVGCRRKREALLYAKDHWHRIGRDPFVALVVFVVCVVTLFSIDVEIEKRRQLL